MSTDVQIAQAAEMKDIREVAEGIGLTENDLTLYGKHKAKISLDVIERNMDKEDGKLVLVTAISPTPAGEGKTTVNIGLSMGLNRIGKKAVSTLREPSLGPSFGIKGGAAGGGYSQVIPMEDINLHFTGDFHAITTTHNLISAIIDNHIHQGNELKIDTRRIVWKRVLDMNDRALRNIVVSLGGPKNGFPRQDGFDITVASEIMAIYCLSKDLQDFKHRVGEILVAYNLDGEPVYVKDLGVEGAAALVMKDAMEPNLVQTLENTPAIIHGGPFANIAHGCNSMIATKMSLKVADYCVTEAGFGADLGAEKFFDIKARFGDLKPNATVIVATIRALKHHGGVQKDELNNENLEALKEGYVNLERHIENVQKFGVPAIVAINQFPSDTEAEIELLKELCEKQGIKAVLANVWAKGGEGAEDLAKAVVEICESEESNYAPIYDSELSIKEKIEKIAKEIYRADSVEYSVQALQKIKEIEDLGQDKMPVCMAKTQYSFSDDPNKKGAPTGFDIHISDLRLSAGAGFIVVLTGDIMTMPGLSKQPAALKMDVKEDGEIVGLF